VVQRTDPPKKRHHFKWKSLSVISKELPKLNWTSIDQVLGSRKIECLRKRSKWSLWKHNNESPFLTFTSTDWKKLSCAGAGCHFKFRLRVSISNFEFRFYCDLINIFCRQFFPKCFSIKIMKKLSPVLKLTKNLSPVLKGPKKCRPTLYTAPLFNYNDLLRNFKKMSFNLKKHVKNIAV